MKKNFLKLTWLLFIILVGLGGCRKEDDLNVDIPSMNPDEPLENTALDQWLTTTFLDPYNMDVVYRYNRYYGDVARNITPPKVENVQPMMQIVLDGFIKIYEEIAGKTFSKSYLPKEWVLFGSNSYPSSGSPLAGDAAAGRRIRLYGLNNGDAFSPGSIAGKLQVVHHEFTHILNQLVAMPTDFESISKRDYSATWSTLSRDSTHKLGFVTSYASGSAGEDFAETVSYLLINGQPWYDYWANTSTAEGRANLIAKEQSAISYFQTGFGIDFKVLQKTMQTYLKDVIKVDGISFAYWLNQNLYKTMDINISDGLYLTYGISADFKKAYDDFNTQMQARYTAHYHVDYLQFIFNSDEDLVVRAYFTAASGGTQYAGDYAFKMNVDQQSGATSFTKVDQPDGTTYSNGNLFLDLFESTIQQYLTSHEFMADWIPDELPADEFTTIAGFYVNGDKNDKFYGTLGH